ncbi:MAG: hypothetical protein QMC85_06065 [Methanocellales archaeon]|nr:hypothetical protein [Methanocellales archaeon]
MKKIVDRLSMEVEKAKKRVEKKRKMIEHGPPRVDVRSIGLALLIAFVVLAMFLVYLAVRHLL